jgi:hypothetical protein
LSHERAPTAAASFVLKRDRMSYIEHVMITARKRAQNRSENLKRAAVDEIQYLRSVPGLPGGSLPRLAPGSGLRSAHRRCEECQCMHVSHRSVMTVKCPGVKRMEEDDWWALAGLGMARCG